MASQQIKEIDLKPYKKGQVWFLQGEDWTSEQRDSGITVGDRPVLIYSAVDTIGEFITVIPFTKSHTGRNGVFMTLESAYVSTLLIQEIRPVPIKKLRQFLGNLSDEKMEEVDSAVKIYLGLEKNDELKYKYFPIRQNIRPSIKDAKYPAPKIVYTENVPNTNTTPKEKSNKQENKSEHIKVGKVPKIDLENLSDDDKKFIITGNIDDIANKFGVSKSTIYNYRKTLKRTFPENEPNTPTLPTNSTQPPQNKSIDKYKPQAYRSFANKKINLFTKEEKILFVKLNPEKLSKVMNVPVSTIIISQDSFKEQLNIDTE